MKIARFTIPEAKWGTTRSLQNSGVCLQAFPSFLPHPLPALLLAPLFSRSLTLVPRSFLLNRTETLATQAIKECIIFVVFPRKMFNRSSEGFAAIKLLWFRSY